MKSLLKFKSIIGATVTLFAVACTIEPFPNIKTEATENPDFEIIRSLGWQTEGIVEEEDLYVVEGDVILYKSYIDSVKIMPTTRQVKYADDGRMITGGKVEGIRVKITSNNLPDAAWREAARQAVDIWNAVPNCRVRFYKIETEILVHNVRIFMSDKPAVADATPPNYGTPGGQNSH